VVGQTAARLGYLARVAEWSKFKAARKQLDEGFFDRCESALETSTEDPKYVLTELAARLAQDELLNPGLDAQRARSWSIPGTGAELRGVVRDSLLRGIEDRHGLSEEELQRAWKFGFFLRYMVELYGDEMFPPEPDGVDRDE
jgi:hypothetical protein